MPGPFSEFRRWGTSWLLVFSVLAVVLFLSVRALVPPPPLGVDAPAEQFAEGRARAIVRVLTEDIGRRVNGGEGYDRAVAYLSTELGKIPGVEVTTQQDSGVYFHLFGPSSPFVYRVTNVLGRLPGKSSEAVLLDAHFDTLPDSVGAADDAAGVACIVEALRVLAQKAPLDRTIIVSLNGGEERGQLGAVSFLKHPWAKDVRAYIYLEALPGGRSALIGSGPGNPWLAQTFAREVSLPLGNVLAQELAQSHILPFAGDFTPFHEAGLAGLDLAMIGDAWALHTDLDRLDRLAPGGPQHMGETTLTAARALASSATSLASDSRPTVYYDLLGFAMVAHSVTTGRWLGLVAFAMFVLVLVRMRTSGMVSLVSVLASFAWNFLGLLAAILAALVPTLVLKAIFHRSVGWYSSPGLVLACFVLPAAAGMLLMQSWWRARALRKLGGDLDRVAWTAWLGALSFWAFWLLLATLKSVAVGFIPLHWVAGGAVAALVATAFPRARVVAALVALVPGAVATVEMGTLLVATLVPMAGIAPSEAPIDAVLAVLVALSTGLVGIVAFSLPCRAGGTSKIGKACAILGVAGIVLTAAHWPYTAQRPKRLLAVQVANDQTSALLLAGEGVEGTRPFLPVFPNATPAPPSWPPLDGMMEPFTLMLPAGLPPMPAPKAEVTASVYDSSSDTRRVTLHLHGTSPQLRLTIPVASLLGWSASDKLPPPPKASHYTVMFEGVRDDGIDFQLVLRGSQPVELGLRAIDSKRPSSPEIEALSKQVPDWVTLIAFSYRMTQVKI
jgi:hypothetical protein